MLEIRSGCIQPHRAAAQMVVLSTIWAEVSPGPVLAAPLPPPPPLLSCPLGPSRCLARSQSPNQIHFICNQLEPLAPTEEISAGSKTLEAATPGRPAVKTARRRREQGGRRASKSHSRDERRDDGLMKAGRVSWGRDMKGEGGSRVAEMLRRKRSWEIPALL